jgi:hypothetical protein
VLVRRTRLAVALGLSAALGFPSATAAAHPVDSFDACVTRADVDFCDDTFSYLFGDVVILKGTVSPVHDEAVVLRKAPDADRWERVAVVPITDAGRMKWRWQTRRRDAVQDAPYLLRFKIPGHGRSDVVEAFVLFGE